MAGQLVLNGGSTERNLEFRKSEGDHLRRLLAWMRVEYMLDEHRQPGFVDGLKHSLDKGFATHNKARQLARKTAAKINHVPQYVRQGVKMLTKMLEHDKRGDTVDAEVAGNRTESEPLVLPAKALGDGP